MSNKVFLFLQSPPGRFVVELANAINERGHTVHRINFCAGDALQFGGRRAVSYRGSFERWPAFLSEFIQRNGVTDIVYCGDRLPYHRVALDVADELGIAATVYENGYLRPDWITLERRGMSAQSHFPTDPEIILAAAANLPNPDYVIYYRHAFSTEASQEVIQNLTTYLLGVLYPKYNADYYYNPLLNYISYVPRLLAAKRRNRRAMARMSKWFETRRYVLVPLQMQNDYQLRANSAFKRQRDMVVMVLRSMAASAPSDLNIVFKIHPNDNGWEKWSRVVGEIGHSLGLDGRFTTIDGGHLPTLLDHSFGVVLINSTVGIQSIIRRRPTKVLGMATFDIPRITHQDSLETFWTAPQAPDPVVTEAFMRLLANSIQVRGSFFNPEGRARAAAEIAERLISGTVNQPGGFVDPPPRLEHARAMGIPFLQQSPAFRHDKQQVPPDEKTRQ